MSSFTEGASMRLTVREPGVAERRVEVGPGAFSVGRGTDCDLVLADVKASRRHALIEGHPDGSYTVRDLESTNGTALNGHRIYMTEDLHDGELITIGATTLTVGDLEAGAREAQRPTRIGDLPPPGAPGPVGATRQPETDPVAESAGRLAETDPAAESAGRLAEADPAAESAGRVAETDPAAESAARVAETHPPRASADIAPDQEPPPATAPPEPEVGPAAAAEVQPVVPASPQSLPRPPRRRSTRSKVLASVGGLAVVLVAALIVAQLTLPGIAASRLRDSLKEHGVVESVSVSAFPAVMLLWHHADTVTVRMRNYHDASRSSHGGSARGDPPSAQKRLADFLASTGDTDSLDARVGQLQVGHLSLESVVLVKHGDQLIASAHATDADIRRALPGSLRLRAFAAGGGELLFTGLASLLGRHAKVRMRLVAHNGALVVRPDLGPFLPSVLSLTVFKDPRVAVESVAARPVVGGFDFSARARLT
jgi:FHA domain